MGPNGLKSPAEIEMKGGCRIYGGVFPAARPDIVPDLSYTHHYGF